MHSDQRIEDLARELNIDSGTSSSSADRMRKIAESIGMNDFNSIYDVDKLEQKLTEMLSEQRRREVLESEDNKSDNTKDKNNVKFSFKGLSPKVSLIIIGLGVVVILIIIFFNVLLAPLMELGIIEIGTGGGTGGGSLGYSDIISSTSYWWPIGSSETETINGKLFATGKPVPTTTTSYFGNRIDPFTGKKGNHTGTDIAANDGSLGTINIIAAQSGTVLYPAPGDVTNCRSSSTEDPCGGGYGNFVKIAHDDGTVTLYAHLYENSITVRVGDTVTKGQVIGKMGSSGRSNGSHLHFEVLVNGERVDGLNYVSEDNPRPTTQGGNTPVQGKDNKQTVCLTLSSREYSQNGVIALMTNINSESAGTFDPEILGDYQNGVPTSYGLCQWRNGRWDNLKNTYPNTYNTIGGQIDFLTYELKNGYSGLYSDLQNSSKTAAALTKEFCKTFERPANAETTCTGRANNSNSFAEYVKNGCN